MNEKPIILIVEDDVDMVESLKKILEIKGYSTVAALEPVEGEMRMKQDRPDLIILDVMFGGKGEAKGFDFARKIKNDRNFASIPIIMLSAINVKNPNFSFSPDTDGEYLPVDCFLDKPLQPEVLFSKINELLSLKSGN